jgi:hypothetical protein
MLSSSLLVLLLLLVVDTVSTSSALINEFNAWFDSHDGVRALRGGSIGALRRQRGDSASQRRQRRGVDQMAFVNLRCIDAV